jgi:hypothetical protein
MARQCREGTEERTGDHANHFSMNLLRFTC